MPQSQPDERRRPKAADLSPPQIAAELRRHVIGQEDATEHMAIIVRQHALSAATMRIGIGPPDPELRCGPVLIIGPTGCGKTLLVRTAAALMGLPYAYEDCTSLTETGFVGRDLSSVMDSLVKNCGGSISRAENGGVVFLDEADKVRRKPSRNGPDISGEGVQRSLLALMDGSTVQVEVSGKRNAGFRIRTSGMLVLAGGAFVGLADIIEKRIRGRVGRIGFGAHESHRDLRLREGELMRLALPEDVISYGMMAEFCGRVAETIVLDDLGPEQLLRILTESEEGPLQRAEVLAAREGIELAWTPRLLARIAAEASEGLGARSLVPLISRATRRVMFEGADLVRKRSSQDLLRVQLDADALDGGRYRVVRHRKEM